MSYNTQTHLVELAVARNKQCNFNYKKKKKRKRETDKAVEGSTGSPE